MADGRLGPAIGHWAPGLAPRVCIRWISTASPPAPSSRDEECRGLGQAAAGHAQLVYRALEQNRTGTVGH